MGHMTAQRLDAIETRLQSVLEEASSLMSASMGGLASGMQQRGTEGGAAEMAETKKTVDTLQGKVRWYGQVIFSGVLLCWLSFTQSLVH
jgi:hypothetical protein